MSLKHRLSIHSLRGEELMQTEIGKMPRSWEAVRIGSVAGISSGGTPDRSVEEYWVGGTIPWVKTAEVDYRVIHDTQEKITQAGLNNSAARLYPKGTLLVAMYGQGVTRGRVGILGIEATTNQACAALTPKDDVDVLFLFYYLTHSYDRLRALGHGANQRNLNSQLIRQFLVPKPPKDEQHKIAAVLAKIQRAVELQLAILANMRELKESLMRRLFTHGLRGEQLKQTEIGEMPQSWEVKALKDAVEVIDYGYSISIPAAANENGIGIVSTADMTKGGKLLYHKIRKIDAPARTIERLTLKDGDVLFNWRNSPELVGKTTIYQKQDEPHIFASFILRIVCGEKKSHNRYFAYLMNYFREEGVFLKLARRAVNQANYNRNEIRVLLIPAPPIDEQIEIAGILHTLDEKLAVHESKKTALHDLFKTTLNQLMSGAVRVPDLDIDISEVEA